MTCGKSKFAKLWDWLAYPEKKDEKCPLAKNQLVDANWGEDISTVMLR